jgi:serine/threonine protein kinase
MAPECFDAGRPRPPIDIYALGATLVELLSGEPLGKLSVSPQRFWPALQARLKLLRFVDLPEGPAREATWSCSPAPYATIPTGAPTHRRSARPSGS